MPAMAKRWGVAHAFAGTGAVLSACLAWTACHSSSVPLPASTGDAASDTGDDGGAIVGQPDGEPCNPCIQVCACTPGFTFYDPGTCTTYTCLDGAWGGMGCLGLGCHEAGEAGDGGQDGEGGGDATRPEEAGDAAMTEAGDSSAPLDGADAALPDAAPTDATSG
jgi:hypothetical protein